MRTTRCISIVACVSTLLALGVLVAPQSIAAPSSRPFANTLTPATPKVIWKLLAYNEAPIVRTVLGKNSEVGSEMLWGAKLTDAKGKHLGVVEGVVITEDTLAGTGEDVLRHRSQTYMLSGGQLEAEGSSYYPVNQERMQLNKPSTIAIVGGTGKFIGAGGQVTTTRMPDGRYKHLIELVRI
jgi:hypothetical protein